MTVLCFICGRLYDVDDALGSGDNVYIGKCCTVEHDYADCEIHPSCMLQVLDDIRQQDYIKATKNSIFSNN